jgi:arylformamidase
MTGTGLYRGFSQADLDRAYSPSSMVESLDPFLARYAADSAAVRARHDRAHWSTRSYGASPGQTLDLFLPRQTPAPLLVFIHGGYWQALSKDESSFPATAFTDAGYGYAAINYTLAPTAGLDEIVEENRRALGYLWNNRHSLGIADSGIVVSGHSAGAHLTAMMLVTAWATRGIDPAFIKAGLLLGGVYDLEPIRQSYVNAVLGMDDDAARRNSPIFELPAMPCPLVVAWAEHDTGEFKRQSRALVTHWSAAGCATVTFEQSGVNHFDSLFDWCNPQSRLTEETLRLLRL